MTTAKMNMDGDKTAHAPRRRGLGSPPVGISFGKHRIGVPRSPVLRLILGVALILGGMVGFLPVLGFWMIPLGLGVLSYDFHWARRLRRKFLRSWGRWERKRSDNAKARR